MNKIRGVNDLIVTDEEEFLLGMDVEINSKEQVIIADTNFVIKETILSFDNNATRNHLNVGCFRRCGKDIIYYYPVSDIFYKFNSVGKLVETYNVLLGDELSIEIKEDYVKIANKRESMNLSYFYKTPFICGDLLVTEGIVRSKNSVVCANLNERTCFRKEYSMNDSLSFSDINFPVYLNDDKIICSFNGALYDWLDEESKVMLNEQTNSVLNSDALVIVVYHLKNKV